MRVDAEQVVIAAGRLVGGERRAFPTRARAVRPVKGQILRLHDPPVPAC